MLMVIKPSIIASGGDFLATTAALTYGGYDFNGGVDTGSPPYASDFKYCNFTDGTNFVTVGTPSSAKTPSVAEPQIISTLDHIDGTVGSNYNIDAVLINFIPGGEPISLYGRIVMYCANVHTSTIVSGAGPYWVATIPSVFTSNGAGNNYTFHEDALINANVSLWGGDGAGGERTFFWNSGGGGGDE